MYFWFVFVKINYCFLIFYVLVVLLSTLPFHVSCINKFELFWVARLTNRPPIPSNNHWVWVIKFYLQEMIHTSFKLLKDCNKLVWILQDKKSFIQNILNAILKYTLLFQFFKFSRFQSNYLLGNPNYISTMKCFFDKFAIKHNGAWPCMSWCSAQYLQSRQVKRIPKILLMKWLF